MNDEYIDIDSAVKRVGGNMGLYKRLLGRFVDGNNFTPLEEALKNGKLEEAEHLAHTLKGVSSNLSLNKVASLSTDLDLLLKNGGDYSGCIAELEEAYAITIGKISELLAV